MVSSASRGPCPEDARRAAEIGCTGIVLSNHGGRQLDGSRAAFDQLAEVVDSVGDRIDVMMDGSVQRGTHILKALSLGAKAVGIGRCYLFPLAAAGQAGVERALGLLRAEIERGMKLMGCATLAELSRKNLLTCISHNTGPPVSERAEDLLLSVHRNSSASRYVTTSDWIACQPAAMA